MFSWEGYTVMGSIYLLVAIIFVILCTGVGTALVVTGDGYGSRENRVVAVVEIFVVSLIFSTIWPVSIPAGVGYVWWSYRKSRRDSLRDARQVAVLLRRAGDSVSGRESEILYRYAVEMESVG